MDVWTLLRLNPQLQAKYVEYICEHVPNVELYFPVYTRMCRPAGRRYPLAVTLPVYPGYVFARVELPSRSVQSLIGAPIKAWYIKLKSLPDDERTISTIPDRVIEVLRTMEERNELVVEAVKESPFKPGRKIVIRYPQFDIAAICVKIRGTRVEAETNLGRVVVPVHTITLA